MSTDPELLGIALWSDEPGALWLQYRSLGLRRGRSPVAVLPASPPELPAGTAAPCWRVADLEGAVNQWESQGARILGSVTIGSRPWQLAQDREGGLSLWRVDPVDSPGAESPDQLRETAAHFWHLMDRRAYAQAGQILAEDAVVRWPSSQEQLTRDQWVSVNEAYPGNWACHVERAAVDGPQVITAARVWDRDDPRQAFHVVSFFNFLQGRIAQLTEYWSAVAPDDAPAVSRLRQGLSARAPD